MHRIVYLSRGHGFSHAVKDLQIIEALSSLSPDLQISIASYGAGLEYYQSKRMPCIDLGIDDHHDRDSEAELRVMRLLMRTDKPDLVVAHEVFSATAICEMLRYRNVFLTHWFYSEIGLPENDRWLQGTHAIVILDFAENHSVPPTIKVPVHFVGAFARPYGLTRQQARRQLGLDENALVITASFSSIPGSHANDVAEMVETIMSLWRDVGRCSDQLYFLLKPEQIRADTGNLKTIQWIGRPFVPELYYCASDVVFASATFTSMSDLSRNCIPTVAIVAPSDGTAPLHAKFYDRKGYLKAVDIEIQPHELWKAAQDVMHSKKIGASTVPEALNWAHPADVASLILQYLPY